MNNSTKKLFTNVRIIILIVALLLSALAIRPGFDDQGVAIRTVTQNSSAALAGIQSPDGSTSPMQREVITSVNNIPVQGVAEYYEIVSQFEAEEEVFIKTNEGYYQLTIQPIYETTITNETQEVTKEIFNETLNETVNITMTEPIIKQEVIGVKDIGMTVYERPTNNIRKGLDLEGGTRVLLEPQEQVNDDDIDLIISNIKQRLNVYGVSDIIVRPTKDLNGNTFISVEIAGVNKDEVRQLLAKQGKFEAKVGNETVFLGGNDIAHVCRTAECSGLDTQQGCGQIASGEWVCGYRFSITLQPEAAQRQADATRDLDILIDANGGDYLSENLTLYLDDQQVDTLRIAGGLKGSAATEISITGSGSGTNRQEAQENALEDMKNMQTVLVTGSLPVKLDIVKTDAISPILGQTFLKNILLVGLLSMAAVILVVFLRYKEWKISIPMVVTMFSEVIILLGIASLIGWRLDLAAIAGIIIAVGTGVDDQIVIADETIKGKKKQQVTSWAEKLKRAFFIIMAAYFTTVVAMLPLWFAGAGLLKGFALTTILGVSIGVFITRPAYAVILETLVKK